MRERERIKCCLCMKVCSCGSKRIFVISCEMVEREREREREEEDDGDFVSERENKYLPY